MFPVTSATEMAGQAGENSIADAAARGDLAGPRGVWAQLAKRLRMNREYVALFMDAYEHIRTPADISYRFGQRPSGALGHREPNQDGCILPRQFSNTVYVLLAGREIPSDNE